MPTERERIRGGLLGLLVGDALGVPYEFHPPRSIPPIDLIEMEPPAGFHRAHRGVPVGTWSDDGALALCLLASLLDRGQFDPEDFGQHLIRWQNSGQWAVDGNVFDVGGTTYNAICSLERGTPALKAGPAAELDNGNGALMRVLPLALWHQGNDADLVCDAMLQSCVTHGHLRSQVCCAQYCLWARATLNGHSDSWTWAFQRLQDLLSDHPGALAELEESIGLETASQPRGSGYVVDSLHSAHWAVSQGDYEQAVKAAISLGNDTDTTACIAGGIAGLRDGESDIPIRWRNGLRGRDLCDPLMDGLWSRRTQSH